MHMIPAAGALAVTLALTAPCSAQEAVTAISPDEFATIAAGGVVIGAESGVVHRGEVIGFIDARPADVTSVIRSGGDHPEWFPAADESGAEHTGTAHGRTSIPVLRDRFWRLNETHRIEQFGEVECDIVTYEYDHTYEEGNMDVLDGYWLICPFNGGTALKYIVNVDIGAAVPRALISWAQNRMLPTITDVIAEQVAAADAD